MATTEDLLILAVWAATLPLIPYALLRKRCDILPALVILFLILLIPIFIGLNTPNPDRVILISVVEH